MGRRKILLFLLLALLGAAVTFVVAFGFPMSVFSSPPSGPVSVSLGSFTTNLDDPLTPHYIQVDISVLVRNRQDAHTLHASGAAVQSGILAVLRNQTYSGTLRAAGMAQVGREVQTALDRVIGKPDVERVYFTSFIVQ